MSERIYTCGIIGLGRMGAGVPAPHTTDEARRPWTHKEAYETHACCEVLWGRDIDRRLNFGKTQPVDIISIATPALYHWQARNEAANYGCKAIFCEKPLAPTLHECDQMVEFCKREGIILAVNHQRAWEMDGVVEYSGDPLETGTHAAELARRFGFDCVHLGHSGKALSIDVHSSGPLVSLKAIDDIIDCIEGRKDKPACDGWAGREAVRVALESSQKRLHTGTA